MEERKMVFRLEQFKELALNTKLFKPTTEMVEWWHYAGINPWNKEYIMLISSYDITDMKSVYVGAKKIEPYYLNYNDACKACLELAEKNVEDIKITYQEHLK